MLPRLARAAEDWDAHSRDTLSFRPLSGADTYSGVESDLYQWLVGDFDGDGHQDLIRRHVDGQFNRIFFGDSDGTLTPRATRWTDGSFETRSGARGAGQVTWLAADINEDGKTDLVRRTLSGSGNLVLISDYDSALEGGFYEVSAGQDSDPGSDGETWLWLVGDFDRDGNDDFMRRHVDGNDNKIYFSNGDGTFTVLPSSLDDGSDDLPGVNDSTTQWLVGDFNGDRKADLARRTVDGSDNVVLLSQYDSSNRQQGSFEAIASDDYVSLNWYVGDFDGDGDDDLARRAGNPNYHRILFSPSSAPGVFLPKATRTADGNAETVGHDGEARTNWLIGDFDGDGRSDFVYRGPEGNTNRAVLSRYRNDGQQGHVTVVEDPDRFKWVNGPEANWFALDINGDGYSDLVRRKRLGDSNKVLRTEYASLRVMFRPDEVFNIPYHSFRIPSIVRAKDGTLVAFAEGRADNRCDYGNINLMVKRSFDGGDTWTDLEQVAGAGLGTWGNPTAVVERESGSIYLFMLHNPANTRIVTCENGLLPEDCDVCGDDLVPLCDPSCDPDCDTSIKAKARDVMFCDYLDRRLHLSVSEDNGATWSDPEPQDQLMPPPCLWEDRNGKTPKSTQDIVGPGTGIQLADGTLVVPAMNRNIISRDGGQTWYSDLCGVEPSRSEPGNYPDPQACIDYETQACPPEHTSSPIATGYTSESTIVQMSNGLLMRNDRAVKGLYNSSPYRRVARQFPYTDFNPAWSYWSEFDADVSLVDNPAHASLLDASTTRRRIVFTSCASATSRTRMLTQVSYDDGTSWQIRRSVFPELEEGLLPERGETRPRTRGGYSSMTRVRNPQDIGLLVEYNGTSSNSQRPIAFRRFNLAWLLDGAVESRLPDPEQLEAPLFDIGDGLFALTSGQPGFDEILYRTGTSSWRIEAYDSMELTSEAFSIDESGTGRRRVLLDVYLSGDIQQSGWLGMVKLYLTLPEQNLFHEYVGMVELESSTTNAWNTVALELPAQYYDLLQEEFDGAQLSIEVDAGMLPINVDNLRFTNEYPPPPPVSSFACEGACLAAIPIAKDEQSGNFDDTGERWYVVTDEVLGWQASEVGTRTISVNGVPVTPGEMPLPPRSGGAHYFQFSAGDPSWTSWSFW